MSAKRRVPGIGLLCSDDAIVVRMVYDGLGLAQLIPTGSSFLSLLEPGSVNKGIDFLRTIRDTSSVKDVPLAIAPGRRVRKLRFWGSSHGKFLHLVGAHSAEAADEIYYEFTLKTRRQERQPVPPDSPENDELLKRNAELEKLIAERTRWLGMAAHDLLHPIGAVLACSELLIEDDAQTYADDQKGLLESIHSSAESMLKLLNDITSISAVESMDSRLSMEPADPASVIRESIALNRGPATSKKINLVFTEPKDTISIPFDRQRMLQVFNNLFENAIKYCQREATVETHISIRNGGVLISVSDNGPGIPADELDNLFTPFQKTRARAVAGKDGTGLGLAICKRILQRHGGRIWAESTVGRGSTFYLSLPNAVE